MVANNRNPRKMYILTMVNEEGYTSREVFASMDLNNVLDVMKGMITIKYQDDRELIEGLLDQFYTIDARAIVRDQLQNEKYYALSGPDETPFEIAVQEDEQDIVDFYRNAEPRNGNNNNNNNNIRNENYFYERQREMNNEYNLNEQVMRALNGGKRKVSSKRKTRKVKKSKKSKKAKKTRRH